MQTKRSRFNRKLLASAVTTAALGLGVAGNAQAAAYAYAVNHLHDFQITSTADYNIVSSSRTTSTSAIFTGALPSTFQDPVGLGAKSDALQATSGSGPFPGQNVWTQALAAGSGARGDAYTSAQSPFAENGVADVLSVAEARSPALGAGTGRGTNSAAASLDILEIHVNQEGFFTFSFNFNSSWTALASTDLKGETATAKVADSFAIYDADGNRIFNWAPVNELAGSDSGIPPSAEISSPGEFHYSQTTAELRPGEYSFVLNATSYADVNSPVPEPASMALIGLGLLGLAATRRRKPRV